MTSRAAFLGAAALSFMSIAPAKSSQRVASLDQCADQYVLALSPRADIVGLSPRMRADDSYLRGHAGGLPVVRADLEAMLAARPRLILRTWGGSATLMTALRRRGVMVLTLNDATDFAGVRANIRTAAQALNVASKGEAIIRGMDAKLARSAGAWGGRRALYLTSGGGTTGRGTLVDAMMRAAGLNNAEDGVGFREVSLESLISHPPEAIVGGFFDRALSARQPWGVGRHAVLRDLLRRHAIVSIPADLLGCPAWFAADAVARIAGAASGRRRL